MAEVEVEVEDEDEVEGFKELKRDGIEKPIVPV